MLGDCLYFPFPCVYREEDTPSSIPNLAVKLLFADDTALCKCGNVGRCRDWGKSLSYFILLYLVLYCFISLFYFYPTLFYGVLLYLALSCFYPAYIVYSTSLHYACFISLYCFILLYLAILFYILLYFTILLFDCRKVLFVKSCLEKSLGYKFFKSINKNFNPLNPHKLRLLIDFIKTLDSIATLPNIKHYFHFHIFGSLKWRKMER